jgi:DNA-binding PadR family transcriptional regulator
MTNAELAILSLVFEAPRHGYEIEQIIEQRGMREWTEIGFSSIYYLLKKLEKPGLIKSKLVRAEGRGPERRVYQITSDGKKALFDATLEALSTPKPNFPSILLGLANLPIISQEQALQALKSFRDELSERWNQVSSRAEAQRPLPDQVDLLFDYSLSMLRAEINWSNKVIINMSQDQST